jgi:hypothetical protein
MNIVPPEVFQGLPCYRLHVMTKETAARLQAIIDATDQHITELRSFGLHDTAEILAVAKLDLQTKLHGISDEELEAFCQFLKASGGPGAADVIDLATRKARNA